MQTGVTSQEPGQVFEQFTCYLALVILAMVVGVSTTEATDLDPDGLPGGLRLHPEFSIGLEEGDSTQVFGRILDMAIGVGDSLYVVDFGFRDVRVYSSTGTFSHSIGRVGPGPGEYDRPIAIDVDLQGNVVVADFTRLHIFNSSGIPVASFPHGSGGRPVKSVAFGPSENLFAAWFDVWDQKIIHEYDLEGKRVASFCDSYAVGRDVDVREEGTIAGGRLEVLEDDLILYAQIYPFEIRYLTLEGDLVRSVTGGFRNLDEAVVFENHDDGYSAFLPTSSRGAIALPNGWLIHSTLKRSHDDYHLVRSILEVFDATGDYLAGALVDGLLVVMCADSRGNVYAFRDDPFPQIACYSVQIVEP